MTATILLKGRGIHKEAPAGGTITPGHLVDINSSGQLVVHATAGRRAAPLFAVENDLVGKGITDNYSSGDLVQAEYLTIGCEVYALVAASAAAIAVGDYLESAGDGTLRKLTSLTDNSGGTANTTIEVVGATNSGDVSGAIKNNFADLAKYINDGAVRAIAQAVQAVDNSGGSSTARIRVVII